MTFNKNNYQQLATNKFWSSKLQQEEFDCGAGWFRTCKSWYFTFHRFDVLIEYCVLCYCCAIIRMGS